MSDFYYEAVKVLQPIPPCGYAREPVFRRMPDGSLLAVALSGGPKEPHDKNVVLSARSEDDGKTWSAPRVLFSHTDRAVWATELFTEGDRPLLFVHTYYTPSFYRELHCYVSQGSADGLEWSVPKNLPNGLGGFSVRQGIVLRNGDWLFPVYWQDSEEGWDWGISPAVPPDYVTPRWPTRCGVILSKDKGKSFSIHGDLRSEYPLWENTVCELEDGRLLMLMRAEFCGYLYRSESFDGGLTWSEPEKTEIPNPNSKLSLCSIEGKTVLALNPTKPAEKTVFSARTRLSLWVSSDGCKTWDKKILLARANAAYFYPHLMKQDEKRRLYVMCEDGFSHYLLKVPYRDILETEEAT